jgi:hypothetical protein
MRKRSPEALYCGLRLGIAQLACTRRSASQRGDGAIGPGRLCREGADNSDQDELAKQRASLYYGDSALNLARQHKRFENKVATTGNFVNCRRNSVPDADEFRQQSSASAYSNGVCSLDGRSAANYIP